MVHHTPFIVTNLVFCWSRIDQDPTLVHSYSETQIPFQIPSQNIYRGQTHLDVRAIHLYQRVPDVHDPHIRVENGLFFEMGH